jgi:subtilisin family serine protease
MAGGNENIIIGLDPMQRNPSGIKVSASDSGNNRARFSNFGRYSDVSAPGKEIYSAIPGNRYVYLDGTSMASPLVAGGVALMKSLRKDLTSEKIKLILQNSGVSLNTDKPMGKLLQLDKALRMVSDSSYNNSDSCPDILNKILELERQLAELRSQCPDLSYQDTLKIPENPTSLDFFTGVWKSTTSLYNNAGKEVEVYFYIDGTADAKLRLEDPDKGGCYAGLKLQLSGREFNMNQQTPADCPGQNYEYNPYIFSCTADANGYAVCTGQNKTVRLNNFTFNLIKIK